MNFANILLVRDGMTSGTKTEGTSKSDPKPDRILLQNFVPPKTTLTFDFDVFKPTSSFISFRSETI